MKKAAKRVCATERSREATTPCSLYCPGEQDRCAYCDIHRCAHSPLSVLKAYPLTTKTASVRRHDVRAGKRAARAFLAGIDGLFLYAEKYGVASMEALFPKVRRKRLYELMAKAHEMQAKLWERP